MILFGLLVTNSDPGQSREYTGPHRILSLNIRKAPNWAGVPYKVTAVDTRGDRRYDKVMLHSDDFGQYLVVGACILPAAAVGEMDKDEPRQVLRNLSQVTLMGWRTDFGAPPEVLQESFRDSPHGGAMVRVYRAKKGSFLVKAEGRQPTRDGAFDTKIASLAARRGTVVVFVLAQNDASPDDPKSVVNMAAEVFDGLQVASKR